jgi:hypothetical protein
LRRSSGWRLGGAGGRHHVKLTGLWLLTPSREELKALRAERAQLQASVDLLASHGGRWDFKSCGVGNTHL